VIINKNFRYIYIMKFYIIALFLVSISLTGCGGSSGGDDEEPFANYDESWTQVEIADLSEHAGGLHEPQVKAVQGSNGIIHFTYYNDIDDPHYNYGIFYRTYNPSSEVLSAEQGPVARSEKCITLSMTLKSDNLPVIAYQGGTSKECGDTEADVMFQVRSQSGWTGYTGAMGFVARQNLPILQDGDAGKKISIVADNENNIHTSYQFFYEGCDAYNLNFPDQDYILFSPPYSDQGAGGVGEETVDGNLYINNSTGLQYRQGDFGKIILNADGNPVVFYMAQIGTSYGIRMATRIDGAWEMEWVETIDRDDWEVGELSPALSPDGTLGVAYYMMKKNSEMDDGDHLRYSEKKVPSLEIPEPAWSSRIVNILSICGEYCSLAYDSDSNPAIAYYTLETYSRLERKNLLFSYRVNGNWIKETVAYQGDIGKYNTLWFNDTDSRFCVSTYSLDDQKVYLYNRYE